MKKILIGLGLLMAMVAAGLQYVLSDEAPQPTIAWSLSEDFQSPESATISERHAAIFVSNVNGYEKNRQGFISRLSLGGELEQLVWLEGINAPTGLTAAGDTLWAVDFDRLLEIDIPSAKIRGTYPAPDANPLLNDVAVGPAGDVFVTGSASNSVYRLENGSLEVWLKDDEALRFANGILVTGDAVVVAAYHLLRIERQTKALRPLGFKETLYDLEGVEADGKGGYLVSVIGARPLYHLTGGGQLRPLYQSEHYMADFDYSSGLVVGPTGPRSITAIKLN